LRAKIAAARTPEERGKWADQLAALELANDEKRRREDAHKKTLRERHTSRYVPKRKGGVDKRSVKHSAINGLSVGSIILTLTTGWNLYKQAKEIAKEMRSEALDVFALMARLGMDDAQIVYVSSAVIIGFLITLGYKACKEY